MEWSARRVVLTIAAGFFFVALPFIFTSSWCLDKIQNWATTNPTAKGAAAWQNRVGWIYLNTMRQDKGAAAYYQFLVKFTPGPPPENPTDEQRKLYQESVELHAIAMYRYALCYDEWSNSIVGAVGAGTDADPKVTAVEIRTRAKAMYEAFLERYPEHPDAPTARRAAERLGVQIR